MQLLFFPACFGSVSPYVGCPDALGHLEHAANVLLLPRIMMQYNIFTNFQPKVLGARNPEIPEDD